MTAARDETAITEDDVREEHEREVQSLAHWAYLFGVVGGGLLAMLGLITVLGRSG